MMDFHAAMETFAEAWVAANTQTPINTDISPQTEVSTAYCQLCATSHKEIPKTQTWWPDMGLIPFGQFHIEFINSKCSNSIFYHE